MIVHSFFSGGYASMSYLVTEENGECGVIIDPSVSVAQARASCGTLPRITAILLTHGHFDHILCLDEWREQTGAPVCVCGSDAAMLENARLSCFYQFLGEDITFSAAERIVKDGDVIPFGNESLKVMYTPGHTAGSCVYLGDGIAFTGDTLFADGGYGRTDLPSGSEWDLRESIARIFTLDKRCRIYPGHGRDSTLNEEKYYHSI